MPPLGSDFVSTQGDTYFSSKKGKVKKLFIATSH